MPKQKPEDNGETSSKNRYSRDDFLALLKDIKNDIAGGDGYEREFKPYVHDEDEAPGLLELFVQSGLDITAPGHWQHLLVAISNAIHDNWSGPTIVWTDSIKNMFMQRMSELERENTGLARLKLCEMFKNEMPQHEHWPSAGTLRDKFQKILKEKRTLVSEGKATDEEIDWVHQFTE